MAKSTAGHIGEALKNAVNLKKIAEAFLRGGWKAAALEAVKRYWPQILAIGFVLLLLPVIIFICVPTMLFGVTGSDGIPAEQIFENYDLLCESRVDMLVTTAQSDPLGAVEITGIQMSLPDFKALLCVLSDNNMSNISTDSVVALVAEIIVSDTYELPEESVHVYRIQYLTMEEYMERADFSDSQKDWAKLLRQNTGLESEPI